MAGGIDWFRWHHGSVTDPKFLLVARRAGASLPDVIAVWAYILEAASAAGDRGDFGVIDAEAVDCMFGFPSTDTRTADILAAMEIRGLTEGCRIVAWDKRQPKRERDPLPSAPAATRPLTSTERSRLHRATKEQPAPDEAMQRHATPCNATNDQETPRGEESREEKRRRSKAVPVGTGVPPTNADAIFALGLPLLLAANVPERSARSMLGYMRKTHGDAAVVDALQRCAETQPSEPTSWLQAALKAKPALPRRGGSPTQEELDAANAASTEQARQLLFGATEILDA